MPWTNIWDLTKPDPNDPAKQGDDEIRLMKAALQERLSTLTNFPNSASSSISLRANTVGTSQLVDEAVVLAKIDPAALAAANIQGGDFPSADDYSFARGIQLLGRNHLRDVGGDVWGVANGTYDGTNWLRGDVTKYTIAEQKSGTSTALTDIVWKLRRSSIAANPIGGWTDLLTLSAQGDAVLLRHLAVGGNLSSVDVNASGDGTFQDDVLARGATLGLLPVGQSYGISLRQGLGLYGLFFNTTIPLGPQDNTKISYALYGSDISTTVNLGIGAIGGFLTTAVTFSPTEVDIPNAGAPGGYKVNGVKVVGSRVTGWATSAAPVNRVDPNGLSASAIGQILGTLINDLKTHGLLGT